jgi:hypothetical protein
MILGETCIFIPNISFGADLRLAYFPKNRPSTVVYMYLYEPEGSQTCMYTCNSMRETSNEGKGTKLEILVEA